MDKKMPVFVKIDEYKDVLDVIEIIRAKIDETRETMLKINDLKNQEDSELEQWKHELEEIQNKMNYIDKSLFDPNY